MSLRQGLIIGHPLDAHGRCLELAIVSSRLLSFIRHLCFSLFRKVTGGCFQFYATCPLAVAGGWICSTSEEYYLENLFALRKL